MVCAETIQCRRGPNHRQKKDTLNPTLTSGTWETPYGKVLANFWHIQNSPEQRPTSEGFPAQSSIAAKIVINPREKSCHPFQIVFDLDHCLNPFAIITYQATIPNDSKIFRIMKHGNLEDLLKALEAKTASLTDRDEEGRSLLNVKSSCLKIFGLANPNT